LLGLSAGRHFVLLEVKNSRGNAVQVLLEDSRRVAILVNLIYNTGIEVLLYTTGSSHFSPPGCALPDV
jgi:hypothetical protein